MYPRHTCLLGLLGVQQVLRSEFGTEHRWQLAVVLQALPGLEEIQLSKGRLSSEALAELEARLRQGQRQPKSLPCPQPVTWLLSQLLTWWARHGQVSLVGASPKVFLCQSWTSCASPHTTGCVCSLEKLKSSLKSRIPGPVRWLSG